ncbi:MAG: NADH-quinone oxidoreductase subunit C [Desulfobulbaceae bacterium]|nr:NADH-quinone oxidoreductase subunit C [Desulfobulbaceae bacterium]
MGREQVKTALAGLAPVHLVETDYGKKGFHLDVQVAPDQVVAAAEALLREQFFIEAVTGVDWLGEQAEKAKEAAKKAADAAKKAADAAAAAGADPPAPAAPAEIPEPGPEEMEVVYDFNHYGECCRVVVRTRVPRDNPELPTISAIYPGANWHERETHDFFGIRFLGHPDLSPLLLPEDADFHPLLKDFKA